MPSTRKQKAKRTFSDFSEIEFFDNDHESSTLISEAELVELDPRSHPLVEMGFETADIVRLAIPTLQDSSDAEIENTLREYLADIDQEQQIEFWGALIGKAVKLAAPYVKKFVAKQGGKLIRKTIKPKARATFQKIGTQLSKNWNVPPNPQGNSRGGRLKRLLALLPAIIKMINELPENAEVLNSDPESLEYLNRLSESLSFALSQITEDFSDRNDPLEALEALMN